VEAGRRVSREALADAIWDDHWPASWESALRTVIVGLRRWVATVELDGAAILRTVTDGYLLDLPAGSTVDLAALSGQAGAAEAALRARDHRTAMLMAERGLAVCSRPLLPGNAGDWVEALRSHADEIGGRLRRVEGQAALALGDAARAEQAARALIDAAPLREDAHRLLMRALVAAGNRGAALAAFHACRRLLSEELGAMPSRETEALFLEILIEDHGERGGGAPAGRPGPAAAGPLLMVHRQSPFVGRAALLERLAAQLDLARAAGPLAVCVTGEPGLGKTRLAAELAARAHASGMTVLYGRADDRIALPYGSLLEALQGGLAGFDSGEVASRLGDHAGVMASLLPSLPSAAQPPDPTGVENLDRMRIEQAIVAALGLVAGHAGALLVLDDMQWASRLELAVVEAVVTESRPLPLMLLVLHRGVAGRAELDRLSVHPRVSLASLEPLTARDVTELAGIVADGLPTAAVQALAEDVWRMSGGNPLLATELLRSRRDGRERESPARIGELVSERIALLPVGAEQVLQAAAVAGLEFDPQMVRAASGLAPAVSHDALDAGRRVGLLVAATRDPQWLAFRHALVRSSLLDSLAPEARLRIHRRLGSALEAEPSPDPAAVVSLAYHFGAAAPLGEWRRAVRYGLPVARAAYQAGVYEDVIAIATRTLHALDDSGDPAPGARLDLEIMLGAAQRALGLPAGHETLQQAFASARDLGDAIRMADAAVAFSDEGAASEELYIDDRLLAHYEEVLDALGARDPHRRAQLLGHVASAQAWERSGVASRRAAREAVALARELDNDGTLANVLTTARRSLSGSGLVDEQEALEEELLALAERLDDPGQRMRASLWRIVTLIEQGRGEALERLHQSAAEDARSLRMGNYHHSLAYCRASLALLRGRVAEADFLVERAAAVGRDLGVDGTVVDAIHLTQLMGVRHEQHRLAELRDRAAALVSLSSVFEWPAIAFIDGEIGSLESVGENVDALLDGYAAHGVTALRPIGVLALMAAPIARLQDPVRAARLYEIVLPFSGRGAYLAYFAGPIDYHLGLLDRVLEREDDARRHFAAALAFCRRLGAPRWTSRCRVALAAPRREAASRATGLA
jgi:DNA-binding SARP family transcriptional activator